MVTIKRINNGNLIDNYESDNFKSAFMIFKTGTLGEGGLSSSNQRIGSSWQQKNP
jgi:hypothetical protein